MKNLRFNRKTKLSIKKSLCVMFSILFMTSSVVVSANTIDSVEAEREEIQAQQEALDAELADLAAEEDKLEEYSELLDEKIALTKQTIDLAIENINKLNDSIGVLEDKIAESEKEYEDTYDLLKERLLSLYETGSVGTLEILLNSSSLYDFALKREAIQLIGEYDAQLMDEIQGFIDATKDDRTELESQKEEVANDKTQLEVQQGDLQGLYDENRDIIAQLDSKQAEIEQEQQELAQAEEEMRVILEKLIEEEKANQLATSGTPSTQPDPDGAPGAGSNTGSLASGFDPCWPVPGWGTNYITSHYGPRWGRTHYGMDIGANYGVPIVATEDGKIISAEWYGGYGNQVVVYHNDTYSTRYAHMSSYAVAYGEYVSKGQVIGYIGSTGNSTGNHLHYEVLLNGSAVDPYPYLV